MNKMDFERGKFAGSLRLFLFNEHLGQMNESGFDTSDPISDEFFFNTWQATASKNTELFEEVCFVFFIL